MSFTGMDIGAVRTLAGQFDQRASDIESLRMQLTSQLDSTPWVGPDRERFLGEWNGQYTQALNQVAEALRNASQVALKNAGEQEAAAQ